ncbi:TetR/AcrR family transcriptional regulator [Longirhabdus pacifica]|uniref:TetR/AcrR family transcriptional regulator n=1 Tax=Longirhabdus pacifica TaxID=2305227 RepID=UPI0013E8D34B|nr:TetR family transcriptional regulator [Longirhabdus pacifica]
MVQHMDAYNMKAKILFSAKKLFSEQGFDGTSVREVCEEAGANIALVSYYFGGKENLYYSLMDTFLQFEAVQKETEEYNEPITYIKQLFHSFITYMMSDKQLLNIVIQQSVIQSNRSQYIQQKMEPIVTKLKSMLYLGKEEGTFHFTSLNETLIRVMSVLLSDYNFLLDTQFAGDENDSHLLKEQIEEKVSFVLGGLGVILNS